MSFRPKTKWLIESGGLKHTIWDDNCESAFIRLVKRRQPKGLAAIVMATVVDGINPGEDPEGIYLMPTLKVLKANGMLKGDSDFSQEEIAQLAGE